MITWCSVDGTSDDLDIPIREVFKDTQFVSKHNICSINSINWARILVQIAHHFFAYFQVCYCFFLNAVLHLKTLTIVSLRFFV